MMKRISTKKHRDHWATGSRSVAIPWEPELKLPDPDLRHLRTLTDDVGMFQHARYSTPDRNHGYCVDDNARALIAVCNHHALFRDPEVLDLIPIYLAFMLHAFNRENGRFRNFMDYDRSWVEDAGSEDSHGRSLWGLGVAARLAPNGSQRALASELFADGLAAVEDFISPRAWAFSLLGISSYREYHGDNVQVCYLQGKLSDRLMRLFEEKSDREWEWLEDLVTYSNAKIPAALLVSGRSLGNNRMIEQGVRSLRWLLRVQTASRGHYSVIGNSQWLLRGGERSRFDQQPVDAMGMVEACAAAYRITGDAEWLHNTIVALRWFLGHNDLDIPLYDESTGGCCDGLTPHGVNANQGAESTLAWLIALLSAHGLIRAAASSPQLPPL